MEPVVTCSGCSGTEARKDVLSRGFKGQAPSWLLQIQGGPLLVKKAFEELSAPKPETPTDGWAIWWLTSDQVGLKPQTLWL